MKKLALQQRKFLVFLLLLAIASGIAIVLQGYFLVAIIDHAFLQNAPFSNMVSMLCWLLLIFIIRTLLQYSSGKVAIQMAANVKTEMRQRLLRVFAKHPLQTSQQQLAGHKVSVVMDAVDELDSYFSSYIPQVIFSAIIPIILLLVMFIFNWTTGVIILITAPFIPIFMMIIGFKTKDKAEEQLEQMAAFSGTFLDTLQGILTLKLFGRAKSQRKKIEQSSLSFRAATMEVLKVAFMNSFALEFISMLSMGLIALDVAVRLIIFENITFFTAFFMLVLAPEFYTKLRELGTAFHTGKASLGAAEKIERQLKLEHTETWGAKTLQRDKPPHLQLQNVSFSYGENGFMLKEITLDIPPYARVAIIGKTGSGKSTLLHLIAGIFSPDNGRILVDGTERDEFSEQDWFARISYISQHPYLFSGTIAENIMFGYAASSEDVKRAAEKAGIAPLIESLKNGYDTQIGEAGRGLSGGEKQRIALARAFLKQPSLIFFDEPTTGLDLETEQLLQQSIEELSKTSTVITVAHRLYTIQEAEQIIFIDDGKIVAAGTHAKLLESVEQYREMVAFGKGRRRQ